jgi:hypothetical protein
VQDAHPSCTRTAGLPTRDSAHPRSPKVGPITSGPERLAASTAGRGPHPTRPISPGPTLRRHSKLVLLESAGCRTWLLEDPGGAAEALTASTPLLRRHHVSRLSGVTLVTVRLCGGLSLCVRCTAA